MKKSKIKNKDIFKIVLECSDKNVYENIRSFLVNDGDQSMLIFDEETGSQCYYPDIKETLEGTFTIKCNYKNLYE